MVQRISMEFVVVAEKDIMRTQIHEGGRTSEHVWTSKETKNEGRGGRTDEEARDEEMRKWRLEDEVTKGPGASGVVTSGGVR